MEKFDKAKLRQHLTPLQYDVCINKGTERPFTGEYWDNHQLGVYDCVVCGQAIRLGVPVVFPRGYIRGEGTQASLDIRLVKFIRDESWSENVGPSTRAAGSWTGLSG